MKEEKSKQPQCEQTLLGIEWTFCRDTVFASPSANRIHKLRQTIYQYLDAGRMSAAECAALTGKLCFTHTWVFNHVARSFLQPLYFRQHHGNPGPSSLTPRAVTTPVAAAFASVKPRRFARPWMRHPLSGCGVHFFLKAFELHKISQASRQSPSRNDPEGEEVHRGESRSGRG